MNTAHCLSLRASTSLLVVLAAALSAPACSKKADDPAKTTSASKSTTTASAGGKKANAGSGGGDDDSTGDDDDDSKKKPGGAGCKVPSSIDSDFTITKGCSVKLGDTLTIAKGATLTIEKGATLAFDSGCALVVDDGNLVAKGTASDPVVFTSSDGSPNAGDWVGIVFDAKAGPSCSLDHVRVEYAGKDGYSGAGAITLNDVKGGRISITNSKIANNKLGGIRAGNSISAFGKLEGNVLKDNDSVSIHVAADVMASVGANKYGDPIHIDGGAITKTATWPKVDVPIVIDDAVSIASDKGAPILTLPDGLTLKFGAGAALSIGDSAGGGLVASNVTFTSAAVTPDVGDWVGLVFHPKATGTTIDGCTIEYAGKGGYSGNGAITFVDVPASKYASRVTITNVTMRKNDLGAIYSSDGDCAGFAESSAGNKSKDGPLCEKQ